MKTKKLSTITAIFLICCFFFAGYNFNTFNGETTSKNSNELSQTNNGILLVNPSFRIFPSNVPQEAELTITTHPTNSMIMFAAAFTDLSSQHSEGIYMTTNGGVNWYGTDNFRSSQVTNHGMDVCPIIDKDGNFIFTYYTDGASSERSTDYGLTWNNYINISNGSPKVNTFSATDNNPSSPYYGRIYTCWSDRNGFWGKIVTTYSTNSGQTWTPERNLNYPQNSYLSEQPDIETGTNGEAYIFWTRIHYPGSGTQEKYLGFAKTTNGGEFWSYDSSAIEIAGHGSTPLQPNNLTVYSNPRFDVDKSGGLRNGWIYAVNSQKFFQAAQDAADVIMYRSSDGGQSWSPQIRVNQDTPGNGKLQYTPSVVVDKYGGINVIYYDNRETSIDSAKVFLSRSTDGGDSWTELPVSDHAFKPIYGSRLEYIGLTAAENKIWVVWTSNKSGTSQMWGASVILDSISSVSTISSEIPSEYKLDQNYPNPFNPSTKITFSLPNNDYVSLKVFDITGKEVAVLVNESLNPGSYEVRFDAANLPSGTYFYRLQTDGIFETKKMLLIK